MGSKECIMGIAFSNVGLSWNDGKVLFQSLSFQLNKLRYGLVGSNGVGKSTIVKLIMGELNPSSGNIVSDFYCEVFKQGELKPPLSVFEYLSDTDIFQHKEALNLLGEIPFEQSCELLSGGEWSRVRLAKVVASNVEFIILDEPTNHLDQENRKILINFIENFQGGMLIISHDRELLHSVDVILELTSQGISQYSGNYGDYQVMRDQERDNLEKKLLDAKKNRDQFQVKSREILSRQEKRMKEGKKAGAKGGLPKILAGARKRNSQKTLGTIQKDTAKSLERFVSEAQERYLKVKRDEVMYTHLPEVKLHHNKMVIEAVNFNCTYGEMDVFKEDLSFSLKGPDRVAIMGSNGSGKSTFLKLLTKKIEIKCRGELKLGNIYYSFIDQEYEMIDPSISVLDNLKSASSQSESYLRNSLSTFLFRGDDVFQIAATLSGGEKLRLCLAKALMSEPVPELLILDEPTNNLDIVNIEFIENLLDTYQGALLVVSHDEVFLENINIEKRIIFEGT